VLNRKIILQSLRHFDWKVVLFALVACYLLPVLVVGSLTASVSPEPVMNERSATLLATYWLVAYLGTPIAGGYFTARFAKNRPQLHVLVVALLGFFLACASYRGPLLFVVAYALVALGLAALGAFLRLRGQRNGG
jgi:hypothetical protein